MNDTHALETIQTAMAHLVENGLNRLDDSVKLGIAEQLQKGFFLCGIITLQPVMFIGALQNQKTGQTIELFRVSQPQKRQSSNVAH